MEGDLMGCVLGIDVGGTSIKAGVFTTEGELLDVKKIPTGDLADPKTFARVNDGLTELIQSRGFACEDVIAVGLDVPGPVDDQGKVGMLVNISLDADGLQDAIRSTFTNAALAFVNDANAAALGELWRGSAMGKDSFVMVTLGTGVGGGVVAGGKLVSGSVGAGGEIGHITVCEDEELVCGCGRRGCLEQYASATGIVRLYQRECAARGIEGAKVEHATDTLTVFKACREGDEAAAAAIKTMSDRLGFALAQISSIVDPSCYLIGGGVAGGFDLFCDDLHEAYKKYCIAPCAQTPIVACKLGNEAGMYGVAYAALQEATE